MKGEDRGRVWPMYGWYSALMACGSCFGTVVWAAKMMYFVAVFTSRKQSPAEKSSLLAVADSWTSAILMTYAIEFLCLCAAKLLVLDRMSVFAAPQGTRMRMWWAAAGRVVMAAVILGDAVGLAANAAAAVYYQKAADAGRTAAAHYAADNTKDGDYYRSLVKKEVEYGGSIASVQRFCEVAVLLLIVIAFVVVGVLCARRVNAKLLDTDAASEAAAVGRALRRQIVCVVAFVFVTFVIRSVLSTMLAIAYELRDFQEQCPGGTCDVSCHNVHTHFVGWTLYMPAFESIIVLVSSPLALLVALWGMTSKTTLQLMKSSGQEMTRPLRPHMLNKQ
jgi:hypothetical protein